MFAFRARKWAREMWTQGQESNLRSAVISQTTPPSPLDIEGRNRAATVRPALRSQPVR